MTYRCKGVTNVKAQLEEQATSLLLFQNPPPLPLEYHARKRFIRSGRSPFLNRSFFSGVGPPR